LALSSVTLSVTSDSEHAIAVLTDGSERYTIERNQRVLRRRPDLGLSESFARTDPAVTTFILDQYRSALNALFTVDAIWMNPVAMDRRLDQNKLLGAHLARIAGLRTIPTILTDSPDEWLAAVDRMSPSGSGLAIKPAGAWAAKSHDGDVYSLFTQRLTANEARDLSPWVAYAPVLLQPYIEKAYELRITVVGESVFCCRIDSQATETTAVDWRHYDYANTPHREWALPDAELQKIHKFMDLSNLLYVAIDMIVTPSGSHVFVEANPAGQFGWIQELTGMPIGDAIADWLTA
jgi:glutathione synthase/RimK-type ligase-like ATP-grasp enzyme